MKTRNGFVSNSSSSSFVIFGANIDDRKDLIERFRNPNGYIKSPSLNQESFPEYTICFCTEDEGTILGWGLGGGDTSCGDFNVKTVTIYELVEYAKSFEAVTGIKPKLMGGCYAC